MLDHPVDRIEPFDEEPEPVGGGASEAFFLWLKTVTHDGDLLCRKEELAARVVALLYLLDGGDKAIYLLKPTQETAGTLPWFLVGSDSANLFEVPSFP